jgi:ABC-type metal ion transport system substrate-binding protein
LLKNNPPLVAIELSGKTDSKNMNRLLQMMDENGHIDKQTILEQIFATAADADANYRNLEFVR